MKKINFAVNLIIVILFYNFLGYASSQLPDEQGLIEINGVKKLMLDHITDVKNSKYNDINDSGTKNYFKNTNIILYNKNKSIVGRYTKLGSIHDFPEEYLHFIHNNNYTYVTFYASEKVGCFYQNHGAIVLNCRNEYNEIEWDLYHASDNGLIPTLEDRIIKDKEQDELFAALFKQPELFKNCGGRLILD